MFGENKKILQMLEHIIANQEQIKTEIINIKKPEPIGKNDTSKDKYAEYKNENGLYGKRRFTNSREDE